MTELKNQLSAIIDRVKAGESVVVTDRGQPVATIEPIRADAGDVARFVRLERSGIVRPALKPPRQLAESLPLVGASGVEALIDERRSSR